MHGAKGVLINITGGSDITLFEIDEAASRIKEEVDEDANIIFGSSFDESLAGKIRVSIVATGIDEKNAVKRTAPYLLLSSLDRFNGTAESFTEEVIAPSAPNEVIETNLEKFSALKGSVASEVENIIDNATVVSLQQEPEEEEVSVAVSVEAEPKEVFNDFDSLEKSNVISEMPNASSLFKAIINKPDDVNENSQLENILSSNENVFKAKSSIRTVEEEPELFPNHNPSVIVPKKQEEVEELIVSDDEEEEYTPTLIERVTGFSIAKRNRKKQKEMERVQEPISPSFSDDEFRQEDRLNLEIPSFLRRK